jgi:YgiT-type zinc finger domain-containing protein
MKDLGYNECHVCGGDVQVVKKTDEFVNEILMELIKVTVPVWVCEDCGNEVYPDESYKIRKRCSGPTEEEVINKLKEEKDG